MSGEKPVAVFGGRHEVRHEIMMNECLLYVLANSGILMVRHRREEAAGMLIHGSKLQ